MAKKSVLIIEDEKDISDLILFNLQRKGYEVHQAYDGIGGEEAALSICPDIIILDLMLPGKDGYAVFRELRRDSRTLDTPVLMLTAKAQTEDRIRGLEVGADDYLTKPFSPKELVLRIEALLKRSAPAPAKSILSGGPFRCDKDSLSFYVDGEPVDLTAIEFKLIAHMLKHPDEVLDRNDLLRKVWNYSDDVHSRTLDTHMKRLRGKLGEYGSMIETVRGTGYKLAVKGLG